METKFTLTEQKDYDAEVILKQIKAYQNQQSMIQTQIDKLQALLNQATGIDIQAIQTSLTTIKNKTK